MNQIPVEAKVVERGEPHSKAGVGTVPSMVRGLVPGMGWRERAVVGWW